MLVIGHILITIIKVFYYMEAYSALVPVYLVTVSDVYYTRIYSIILWNKIV